MKRDMLVSFVPSMGILFLPTSKKWMKSFGAGLLSSPVWGFFFYLKMKIKAGLFKGRHLSSPVWGFFFYPKERGYM